MRIAYLLSEYPTLGHTYLLREVRELRALGWDIQTISIRRPGKQPSSMSAAEAEELKSTWYVLDSPSWKFLEAHLATFWTRPVHYLRGLAMAWRFARFTRRRTVFAMAYFTEAILAGRWVRKAGFTRMHSVFTTTVALIVSRIFEVPLSMTIHGPEEFLNPAGFGMEEKVKVALFVSAISHFGKSQIMQWSCPADWQKLEVTPLGIDCAGWVPATFREDPTPFHLIFVGRLAPVKGCLLLLEAVAALVEQGRDIRLTLVGEGPQRSQLVEQARRLRVSDKVVFAGSKTQTELHDLYGKSDVCVLSSFAEGIPVVFMEAMALGVPCVGPRIAGIPELIRHGVEGLLVTPAKVDELVAAIGEMMDKPVMRRQMALSSRQRVVENYNLRRNVAYLAELFSRYAPQTGGPCGVGDGVRTRRSTA
jgi:colanic acid/amylovoran biosynthesis glycosyltransferase